MSPRVSPSLGPRSQSPADNICATNPPPLSNYGSLSPPSQPSLLPSPETRIKSQFEADVMLSAAHIDTHTHARTHANTTQFPPPPHTPFSPLQSTSTRLRVRAYALPPTRQHASLYRSPSHSCIAFPKHLPPGIRHLAAAVVMHRSATPPWTLGRLPTPQRPKGFFCPLPEQRRPLSARASTDVLSILFSRSGPMLTKVESKCLRHIPSTIIKRAAPPRRTPSLRMPSGPPAPDAQQGWDIRRSIPPTARPIEEASSPTDGG